MTTSSARASSSSRSENGAASSVAGLGKQAGVLQGAGGDDDLPRLGGLQRIAQMLYGELGHISRADDQNLPALEAGKRLPNQIHGDGRHAGLAVAQGGFGADAFGDAMKAMVEQAVQKRWPGGRPCSVGGFVGGLELIDDLIFAQDHGIKAADDAEDMSDGRRSLDVVEVGGE